MIFLELILKLKEKRVSKEYLYLLLRNDAIKQKIEKMASGTSQKNLSPVELGKRKVIIPLDDVNEKFAKLTNGFTKMIVELNAEKYELSNLRDFLLPLLMNGQVGFKE